MTLSLAKHVALETYVSLRRGTACHLRREDRHRRTRCAPQDDARHIEAAVAWLLAGQDATADDGVAAMYSLVQGWVGSYPETTGYIIPTLYDVAEAHGADYLRARAERMASWLLTCQLDNGAFPGSFVGRTTPARVFNTGQAIFGLVRAAFETSDTRYAKAACRAGDWLIANQDDDGGWRRWTFNDTPHTYNVRTAWALLELARACSVDAYREAGMAAAMWSCAQQCDSGWFAHNAFMAGSPNTTLHTHVYALRGLLECGVLADNDDCLQAAVRAAEPLQRRWQDCGFIPGCFPLDFSAAVRWRCLPGEAQLCAAWLRLAHVLNRPDFDEAATTLLEAVKATQLLDDSEPALRGGLSGSYPINGGYERYCLVNWGPKFLIDALLLKGRSDDAASAG